MTTPTARLTVEFHADPVLPPEIAQQILDDVIDAINAHGYVSNVEWIAGREPSPTEEAVPDREGCTPIAELDAMAVDTYPHRGEDAATLTRFGVADDVAARVLDYLAMRNRQDAEDCKRNGYWFARSDLYTVDQPARARKYVRLVTLSALTPAAERRERGGSVVCFLETGTGRLRQADGWKGPGPRVIGDLSTDAGAARLR